MVSAVFRVPQRTSWRCRLGSRTFLVSSYTAYNGPLPGHGGLEKDELACLLTVFVKDGVSSERQDEEL